MASRTSSSSSTPWGGGWPSVCLASGCLASGADAEDDGCGGGAAEADADAEAEAAWGAGGGSWAAAMRRDRGTSSMRRKSRDEAERKVALGSEAL